MKNQADRTSLSSKVQLRRHVLGVAKFDSLSVLDLCAEDGTTWKEMRKHVEVRTYTPVAKKGKQPGTLKEVVNARLIEALYLSKYNIVDIDTFGDPWELWWTVFNQIITRTAVFVTAGSAGLRGVSRLAMERMGIPEEWSQGRKEECKLPNVPGLADIVEQYFVVPFSRTCQIERAFKAELVKPGSSVSYYGLLCKPLGQQTGAKRKIDVQ